MDPNLPSSPTSSRKFRFAPKPPPRPRRAKNKVELKTESSRHDASDDEAPDARLLRRANVSYRNGDLALYIIL
nr:DNA-directed RNA polymerase III subunit RPC4-like isoform X1 [Ipomoea batatas]